MSKSITQDMAYRQSLMKYAEKYGVSRAGRKYNKSQSLNYNNFPMRPLNWLSPKAVLFSYPNV